jgi:competence protein CoiA
MKYALVNGEKVEATKGAKGYCPNCGSEVVAYCGEVYVNHWKHKGNRICDPWWENETNWHRSWKNSFPKEWQEIFHTDENTGEKHIADVKTDGNWVLEFQHSYIKPEERSSRTAFYPNLVWVLDGTRRKRDKLNFHRILDEFAIRSVDPRFKTVIGQDDCKLIKEWHESNALVFLDFQDEDESKQPIIWFLFPKTGEDETHLFPILRYYFIELHNNGKFDELVEKTISPFIKKLIDKKIKKDEIEKSREQERKARMNMFLYGRKTGRF